MQIIEVSVAGVRSSVITLQHRDRPLRFVLFPMLHIGTAGYYQSVTTRLAGCDLVVAEGVSGRSAPGFALALAYRTVRYRRGRLVVQDLDLKGIGVPVIMPDMTMAEFRRGWRELPVRERLLFWCLAPLAALTMLLFGSRRVLGRFLAVVCSPEPQPPDDSRLNELIVDRRDALLTQALASIHQERGDDPLDVAVVYGGGHMPAVIRTLHDLGYRARTAEWLTIWEF